MLSRPPRTTNSPASQRTRGLNRFSNSSGMVITPEARSGPITNPVRPTNHITTHMITPIAAPAKPFS